MIKKSTALILMLIIFASFITACASEKEGASRDAALSYEDFISGGKIFAAQLGDIYGAVANDIFKAKDVHEFVLAADMLEAVRIGKVDAAITDDVFMKQMQDSGMYPDLECIPVPADVFVNRAAHVFRTEELRDQFDEWFEAITNDGTFDEIYNRWIGVSLPDDEDIPRFNLTGENGTLRINNTGNFPPFSYFDSNNELVGFDAEITNRFAAYMGMNAEYTMMSYDAIIPYVISGKADMSGCSFTVTDDRAESVLFGTQFAKACAVLIIPKRGGASTDLYVAPSYADYINAEKQIAVQTGDVYGAVARDVFKTQAREYPSPDVMLEELHKGRIDAALIDSSYVKPLIDSGSYSDVDFLWIPKAVFVNESAPVFHDDVLRAKYDEWLAGIAADGTLDEIINRWIGVPLPKDEDIPRFDLTNQNGTLRVCDTGNYPPFTYFDANGRPVGFDAEMMNRFALYLGMDLDIAMMSYDAILPTVLSGKADMSACIYTITEEREDNVIFGAPCIVSQGVLVVPKTGADIRRYTEFAGKDIAVLTGVLTYDTTERIGGKPVNYNDSSSAAEDVRQGRVAGYMHALTAVQVMAARLDGFEVIPVPKEIFSAQIAGISHDRDVTDRFDVFLEAMEADGTLDGMRSRWFGGAQDLDAPIPKILNTGANGVLKVAVCSDAIPYVYIGANGTYTGFSAELALRFGAYEGKTVEFTDMEFGGLIPYIASQKADIALANMAITEERAKSVLFTAPFFDEQHGILAKKQAPADDTALAYTDFAGKRIGMKTGSIWDGIIEDTIKGTPAYYSEMSASIEDIRKGRLDGFITDLSAARVFVATEGGEDLICVDVPAEVFSAPMGAVSLNQDLVNRFNAFLAEIKADGTLDDVQARWLWTVPDLSSPMPEISLTNRNGVLKVATTAGALPFSYMGANGELKGYSIELVRLFAAREGMDIEFAEMEFSGMISYVVSGKADLAIADISITEERKKSVLFTDSIYDDQGGIITLRKTEGEAQAGGGFAEWLTNGIQRNLLTENRWKLVVNGLAVTMVIAVLAQLFGTVFGCFVCWILTRKNRFVRWLGNFYCGLIHGAPIVVLLMITYYIIFGDTNISNVLIAVAAFTMITGAGVAGNLKGAIDTIDAVEIEAARSIGFSAFKAFQTVTLPQAIKRALPGYTNSFVELVKATAIVGYIAIQDLTRAGDIIRSRTYDAYFPLLLVAAIYLIVTTICVQAFKFMIKKANGGEIR